MRAQSKFYPLVQGLFRKPVTEQIVDRRKKTRTIRFYSGVNKGKSYPYRSKKRGG